MPLKQIADGRHGEIKRMLVIDLIVRRLVEYIAKIRIFKHEYATWLEQNLEPCNNRMQFWVPTCCVTFHIFIRLLQGSRFCSSQVAYSCLKIRILAIYSTRRRTTRSMTSMRFTSR